MMKLSEILRPTPHRRRKESCPQHLSSEHYALRTRSIVPLQSASPTSHPSKNNMAAVLTRQPHFQHQYDTRSPSQPSSPVGEDRGEGFHLPSIRECFGMQGHEGSKSRIFLVIPAFFVLPPQSDPQGSQSSCSSSGRCGKSRPDSMTAASPGERQPSLPPQEAIYTDPSLHSKAPNSPSVGSTHPLGSGLIHPGITTNLETSSRPPPPSSHPVSHQATYSSSAYSGSPTANSAYSYPSPGSLPYSRQLPTSFPSHVASITTSTPTSYDSSHTASPVDPAYATGPNSGTATPYGSYGPPLLPSANSGTDSPPPSHNYPSQAPPHHHHYISPASSAAQYAASQPQDRYVCATCSKAFSRPSSLKIHSHSHTGEKPYRCPHGGCGKAFSVRSNMKRHERGCHGGGSPGSTPGL